MWDEDFFDNLIVCLVIGSVVLASVLSGIIAYNMCMLILKG